MVALVASMNVSPPILQDNLLRACIGDRAALVSTGVPTPVMAR